ncbi:hypothetical protein HDU92_004282 [Lobulomyces angularis]|nr:hypothetical protein HDU92_004282 [Lobulomyces angularis]
MSNPSNPNSPSLLEMEAQSSSNVTSTSPLNNKLRTIFRFIKLIVECKEKTDFKLAKISKFEKLENQLHKVVNYKKRNSVTPSARNAAKKNQNYSFITNKFNVPKFLIIFVHICLLIITILTVKFNYFSAKVDGFSSVESIGCFESVTVETSTSFFEDTFPVRCASQCSNARAITRKFVGGKQVQYQPFIVGSEESGYRADTWICMAALQQKLINHFNGGCVVATVKNSYASQTFNSSVENANVKVTNFDSTYPLSLSLSSPSEAEFCEDKFYYAIPFFIVGLIILPFLKCSKSHFYWSNLFWISVYFVFVSPFISKSSYNIGQLTGLIIPLFSVLFVIYRWISKFSLPTPADFPIDLALFWLLPMWIGIHIDTIEGYLPPFSSFSFSSKMFRADNMIPLILIIGVVLSHHYVLALFLVSLTKIQARFSLIIQGIFLGFFLSGILSWGFDSFLETNFESDLGNGFLFGSSIPTWNLNFTNLHENKMIEWNYEFNQTTNITSLYQDDLVNVLGYDSAARFAVTEYVLMMNDIKVYQGKKNYFQLKNSQELPFKVEGSDLPFYFRVSTIQNSRTMDFSKALEILKTLLFNQKGKTPITQACDYCRIKKRKCDGAQPRCGNCSVHNNEDCTFKMEVGKRGPKKGNKSALLSRLDHLESLLASKAMDTSQQGQPSNFERASSYGNSNQFDTNSQQQQIQQMQQFYQGANQLAQLQGGSQFYQGNDNNNSPNSTSIDSLLAPVNINLDPLLTLVKHQQNIMQSQQNQFGDLFNISPSFFSPSQGNLPSLDFLPSGNLNFDQDILSFIDSTLSPTSVQNSSPAIPNKGDQFSELQKILIEQCWFKTTVSMVPIFEKKEFFERLRQTEKTGEGYSDPSKSIPFPQYLLDAICAFGAVRSKHRLLYTPDYGGSPIKASELFATSAVEALKGISMNEHYSTECLQTMSLLSYYFFHVGAQDKGFYWMVETYKAAQVFNWDIPSEPYEEKFHPLMNLNPSGKKDRRCVWAIFILQSTFGSRPLLCNERDHLYMTDPSEWEALGFPTEDTGEWHGVRNANRMAIMMQLVFLYRRVIRYCADKQATATTPVLPARKAVLDAIPFVQISDIHRSLLVWHENIPSANRAFNSLTDFIQGSQKMKDNEDWVQKFCNLQVASTYLLALAKIHHHNSKSAQPTGKFQFSTNHLLVGTSLDMILVCIRAFASLMVVPQSSKLEEDSEYKMFYSRLSLDTIMAIALSEVIEFALDCIHQRKGWAAVIDRRVEVMNHTSNIFMKILKMQNEANPLIRKYYDKLSPIINDVVERVEKERRDFAS